MRTKEDITRRKGRILQSGKRKAGPRIHDVIEKRLFEVGRCQVRARYVPGTCLAPTLPAATEAEVKGFTQSRKAAKKGSGRPRSLRPLCGFAALRETSFPIESRLPSAHPEPVEGRLQLRAGAAAAGPAGPYPGGRSLGGVGGAGSIPFPTPREVTGATWETYFSRKIRAPPVSLRLAAFVSDRAPTR